VQVVFFGTPEIAVPTLEALIAHKDITVVAAVSQPDRPAGRGQKMQAPPVKIVCQKHNIPVFQPPKLSKAPEVFESLKLLNPDLIIMVAFGQILKKNILELPKYGVINLHASLLPAYRGAAPINWCLINGDKSTGITTMFTEAGLDTGPMLLKEEFSIDENLNSEALTRIKAEHGAKLTVETIERLKEGNLQAVPQDDSKATYAPILSKETGRIDWSLPANRIHNLVRGLIPWPLSFTYFRNNPIKIWQTATVSNDVLDNLKMNNVTGGSLVVFNKQIYVCCGNDSWLEIKEVQPMNKQRLAAKDWSNGIHLDKTDKFDSNAPA
jgi:methionyl-tRNA formyltransferase